MFLATQSCDLVGELWKDPGYRVRGRKLVMRYSEGVRRESVEAETAEVPLKPRKDPTKSFLSQGGYPGSR